MTNKKFEAILKEKEIKITEEQMEQLNKYYNYLIEENEKMNLTSITKKEEVYIKHFLDSIEILNKINLKEKEVLDIGSGAGFPGIVLKIMEPSIKLTIVDSLRKRIDFLSRLSNNLSIYDNVLIHGRIEEQKELKESFDVVTSRAVANLSVISEMSLPFVKINSYFIPMKGLNVEEEIVESGNAIKILGGNIKEVYNYKLPDDMGERNLIIILKENKTNLKYPRQFSKIKKQQLN